MDTVENTESVQKNKIMNLFGTAAYGLIVIGSFLPAITINMWGISDSVSGLDFYGLFAVFLMLAGSIACAVGLPKLVAKGLGALSLAYLYYHLFKLYGELRDMYVELKQMTQFMGNNNSPFEQIIEIAASSVSIGSFVLVLGFILLNVFIFMPYKIHPRFEALDTILMHYSSKLSEQAKVKSQEIKVAATKKAASVQEKSKQIKQEAKAKSKATEDNKTDK
ncbi:hypothetical protein AB4133_20530 [Vibrio sp. 10N.286.52.F8]|uniref:hypothetical protein n=1 Tax=Vibrio sp. 10N.286.52.F8 TaxID=3229716 RepID=UPI00354DB20E